ncbi:MAG TPA: DNA recombination protein RmuC [Sedimentisphaerales bacterium]|nr:DNA recombination protein RmuC [Sedimentisphaerales bacterium]
MESILIAAILVLVIIVVGLLFWLINSSFTGRKEISSQATAMAMLQQQLESIKSSQNATKDNLQQSLQTNQISLTRSLESSQKVLNDLHGQIGKLQGTNQQMLEMGNDVKRLQYILSSPKLRGQMGERSLESLLANLMPTDSYELQHSFKSGKIVDALIRLDEHTVPIDAKFPLPAFEKITKAETEDEKVRLRKVFHSDVIKHIEKIAEQYILPAEGTLDFALMYIPAENIYYETIVKYPGDTKDIVEIALDKKVIPVSPNLLFTYLSTIVMGLNGLQIEKQAAHIRQNLKKLNSSFAGFASSWEVLGKHLRNAATQYDEGNRKLDKFSLELEQIQSEETD